MTNQRSYNTVKTAEEAIMDLSLQTGVLYDPEVVDHFLKLGNPAIFERKIRSDEDGLLEEIFPMEGFIGLFIEEP